MQAVARTVLSLWHSGDKLPYLVMWVLGQHPEQSDSCTTRILTAGHQERAQPGQDILGNQLGLCVCCVQKVMMKCEDIRGNRWYRTVLGISLSKLNFIWSGSLGQELIQVWEQYVALDTLHFMSKPLWGRNEGQFLSNSLAWNSVEGQTDLLEHKPVSVTVLLQHSNLKVSKTRDTKEQRAGPLLPAPPSLWLLDSKVPPQFLDEQLTLSPRALVLNMQLLCFHLQSML